jgi:uncharacterized protein YbaP (TraB family)
MKSLIVTVALVLSAPCLAQSTVFVPSTQKADVPCVYTWDSSGAGRGNAFYRVHMFQAAMTREFVIDQLEPVAYGDYCSGTFDVATGLYGDIVNVGDDSYDVRMRRGEDGRLRIESATLRGAATTSLWVARNGANTVYLAGTIHKLNTYDHPLPRAYEEAYSKSSALWFEIDLDNPTETGENMTVTQFHTLMRDRQRRTLSQTLTPTTYQDLRGYLHMFGVEIESVNAWAAQNVVSYFSGWQLQLLNGVTGQGVDDYLAARARADGKPIGGLETGAAHYAVLQNMDEGDENAIVNDLITGFYSGETLTSFRETVALWRNGDTSAITRSNQAHRPEDYQDYALILLDRNNAWMPQIVSMLQTPQTEMVAVGVAHMAGPDGLVAQLRARGYSVERY